MRKSPVCRPAAGHQAGAPKKVATSAGAGETSTPTHEPARYTAFTLHQQIQQLQSMAAGPRRLPDKGELLESASLHRTCRRSIPRFRCSYIQLVFDVSFRHAAAVSPPGRRTLLGAATAAHPRPRVCGLRTSGWAGVTAVQHRYIPDLRVPRTWCSAFALMSNTRCEFGAIACCRCGPWDRRCVIEPGA